MMKLNPAATITEEFAERIKSENRSAKMMKLAPLIVLACLVVVFLIVCGASFLSPKNIMNILNQMALPLVVALGLTFVIMLGSIDLSIDGSVGMAGSLFAPLFPKGDAPCLPALSSTVNLRTIWVSSAWLLR